MRGDLDLTSEPWPQISEEAKDLLKKVLTIDPAQRPTISEMLTHPWLREHGVASDAPLASLVVDRMRKFANLTKLRKAAVLVAAQHLSHDEINGLNAPNLGDTVANTNGFMPKKTAIIRSTFKNEMGNYAFGKDSAANVKLTRYGLDELSFSSSNSKDGLAVFSDIYYAAGWKAFVDGKETPIFKADYVLRAIKLPAGQHKIEFQFKPESFYKGRSVSMISSILLILLCVAAFVPQFNKKDGAAAAKG